MNLLYFLELSPSLQGGGFIAPLALLLAGLWTLGRYFFGYNPFSKSPFTKMQLGTLLYAGIFIAAAIGVYIWMQSAA